VTVAAGAEGGGAGVFVDHRNARHQLAEDAGGDAAEVVAVGVADQGDTENTEPEHEVTDEFRGPAAARKGPGGKDDQDGDERHQLPGLLLGEANESAGIGAD